MKLPLSILNIDEHQDYIFKLLNDPETVIYIDTNIIALLYRLNNKSREELFNFLKPYIDRNQLKVPNWVVNEYSNRFIRDQIFDYLSPLNSLKTMTKEYNNVFDFLNMHIDEDVLSGDKSKTYKDIDELKADVNELKKIFRKINFISKNKNPDYVHRIHTQIESLLNTCHIESDLNAILTDVSKSADFRFDHKFPPGFRDLTKGLNECGDLIIWNEIILHSEANQNKKVLFLTNDEKKDWVYAPIKITENNRLKNNSEYKIIDPRLVHEFFIKTKSEEIEIIAFDNFIKILIQKHQGNFIELGRSLQLISNLDNPIEQTESANVDTNEVNSSLDSETPEITIKQDDDSLIFNLNDTALKDKYIALSDENDKLTQIIIGLKSYNWYRQNPEIDYFVEKINNYNFTKSQEEQTKLFAIGRNIYQAACGSSSSAISLISDNLNLFIQRNNNYVVNLVAAGMVYEIYFDSENNFRKNRLKSQFINELQIIENNPRLEPARKFITEKIAPFSTNLIYVPFSNSKLKMEVKISEELHKVELWYSGIEYFNIVEQIFFGQNELLTAEEGNNIQTYQSEFTKLGIENLICTSYGIPSDRLELEYKNFTEGYKLILNGKYLKSRFD